jgi:two-component system response regulator DevR
MMPAGISRLRLERRFSVLIVESHELVRLGLRSLLSAHPSLEVVGEVSTIAGAVAAVTERHPALVVVASRLTDGTGLQACREIVARAPQTRVVVLGGRADEASMLAAARVGALGWLSRYADAQSVCRTLRDVAAGVSRLARTGAPERDILALTEQERRVLRLVAQGKTNKEIGNTLGLSEKTVKNYLSHAFEKLGVARRAQAAVLFTRRYGARPLPAGSPEPSAPVLANVLAGPRGINGGGPHVTPPGG